MTITAANSDTLSSVGGVVSETENTANIETQETVTGGAGRFADAHGDSTTASDFGTPRSQVWRKSTMAAIVWSGALKCGQWPVAFNSTRSLFGTAWCTN